VTIVVSVVLSQARKVQETLKENVITCCLKFQTGLLLVTRIKKALFPVIDMHAHDYAKTAEEVEQWIKNMDECGIEKSIILTQASGPAFDSIYNLYAPYPDRFEVWCGFDYTDYDKPNYGPEAVRELERCYKLGARGVGEEGDKGLGLSFNEPVKAWGLHFDDPKMKPLFDKCAELGLPVNIHVADPIWMYQKMDSTNDGLMNAQDWRIDLNKPGILGFDELIQTLENAVKKYPNTVFIACHFANLNDMDKLGLFDKYPNLFTNFQPGTEVSHYSPLYEIIL
jgi:predicted TIM-barrel fold metal-dependent hydrolase